MSNQNHWSLLPKLNEVYAFTSEDGVKHYRSTIGIAHELYAEPITWSVIAWEIGKAAAAWYAAKSLDRILGQSGNEIDFTSVMIAALRELNFEQDIRDALAHTNTAKTLAIHAMNTGNKSDLSNAKQNAIFGYSKLREVGYRGFAAHTIAYNVYICCQQEIIIQSQDDKEKDNLDRDTFAAEKWMLDRHADYMLILDSAFWNPRNKQKETYEIVQQVNNPRPTNVIHFGYYFHGSGKLCHVCNESDPEDWKAKLRLSTKQKFDSHYEEEKQKLGFLPKGIEVVDMWRKMREGLQKWNKKRG